MLPFNLFTGERLSDIQKLRVNQGAALALSRYIGEFLGVVSEGIVDGLSDLQNTALESRQRCVQTLS